MLPLLVSLVSILGEGTKLVIDSIKELLRITHTKPLNENFSLSVFTCLFLYYLSHSMINKTRKKKNPKRFLRRHQILHDVLTS